MRFGIRFLKEILCQISNSSIIIFVTILLLLQTSANSASIGTLIKNSAKATFSLNKHIEESFSNTHEINTTIHRTPSKLTLYKYSPDGKETLSINQTKFDNKGMLVEMNTPLLPNGAALDSGELPVSKSKVFNMNDPIFIVLEDLDQNNNIDTLQTIFIEIKNDNGDQEVLKLMESSKNSGIYTGYIQTSSKKNHVGDGFIYVKKDMKITASYTDEKDLIKTSVDLAVIEPYQENSSIWVNKTASKNLVSTGEFIKYTVDIKNSGETTLYDIEVFDKLPVGLKYQNGSSLKNDTQVKDPDILENGLMMKYKHSILKSGKNIKISYIVEVGTGINGNIINHAWAENGIDTISNIAKATIKVKDDLYRNTGIIMGQVHKNGSPMQGVKGVKLYLENGTYTITDKNGNYHFEGIKIGTHIVQLDLESFNGKYKEKNSKFAQFVDLHQGGLKRVDFCLKEKEQDIDTDDYNFTITHSNKKMPQFTPDDIDKTEEQIKWLWPSQGFVPAIPSTSAAILHNVTDNLQLFLNGKKVDALNYHGTIKSFDKTRVITIYKGIDLKNGDNSFTAKILDRSNDVKKMLQQDIHVSTMPVKAKMLKDKSYLIADGKYSPIIAVQFFDKDGYHLRSGMQGSCTIEEPYSLQETANKFKIHSNGIAYIKLKPTTQSGKVKLHFPFQSRDEIVTAWLKSKSREWILVGFAEGSIGYNTLKGNLQNLKEKDVKDKIYQNGKASFFAKGAVKGDVLLTIAYDSGKKEQNLFGQIDPKSYYTLYHDGSKQVHEASSRKKLYLKIEKNKFYALFGDFTTGLSVNTLSKYQRSFNGLKSEYQGENFEYSFFISDTNSIFVKDEIQGDGTSGLHHLKNRDIVINSEKIYIETRDRYRDEKVIKKEILHRFRDYEIDYDEAALYFKKPVYSKDQNFNPQYIIVDYEIKGDGKNRYTYGGRGEIKLLNDKFKIGATYIKEDLKTKENALTGVDLKAEINKNLTIKAEYAKTQNKIDNNATSASAYNFELEYRVKGIQATAYLKEQQEAFGLGQQNGSLNSTRKYGVDVSRAINENFNTNISIYTDEQLKDKTKKDVALWNVNYTKSNFSTDTGYRYTKDNSQIITGISKSFFDNKLVTKIKHEQSLQKSENDLFPTKTLYGIDYKLNNATELFFTHERARKKYNQTIAGFRNRPWNGASMHSSIISEFDKDSTKLYSNFGFLQGWQITQNLNVHGGIDKVKTLKSNKPHDDFITYNSSLNYTKNNWTYNIKGEYKESIEKDKINFGMGAYTQANAALGLALGADFNKNDQDQDFDAKFALAYRPNSSKLIFLHRFDYIYEQKQSSKSKKFVNNMHLNYKPNHALELSLQYGLKYNVDFIDGKEHTGFVDLIGFDTVYDITDKVNLGLHGTVLHTHSADQYDYSFGISTGYNLFKNAWMTLGYNFSGFSDNDFSLQNYRHKGPYLRFKIKFDQQSVKEIAKKFLR